MIQPPPPDERPPVPAWLSGIFALLAAGESLVLVVSGVEAARVHAGYGADQLGLIPDATAWAASALFPPVVAALTLRTCGAEATRKAASAVCAVAVATAALCLWAGFDGLGWGWVDGWHLSPYSPVPILAYSLLGMVWGLVLVDARLSRRGLCLAWLGVAGFALTLWIQVYLGDVSTLRHEAILRSTKP